MKFDNKVVVLDHLTSNTELACLNMVKVHAYVIYNEYSEADLNVLPGPILYTRFGQKVVPGQLNEINFQI